MTCNSNLAEQVLHSLNRHCFCTMHTKMSDFETANLHCFGAPGFIQFALNSMATSSVRHTSGKKQQQQQIRS